MKREYTKLRAEGMERGNEKALQRSGQYIKTADDLLKVVFLYLAEGTSYGQTAALLQMTGEYPLTKNEVYERVKESADRLKNV